MAKKSPKLKVIIQIRAKWTKNRIKSSNIEWKLTKPDQNCRNLDNKNKKSQRKSNRFFRNMSQLGKVFQPHWYIARARLIKIENKFLVIGYFALLHTDLGHTCAWNRIFCSRRSAKIRRKLALFVSIVANFSWQNDKGHSVWI